MFTVQTFKKGFTLIELMVVIAVIAILATIALFGLGQAQKVARDTQRQQIMNALRASLQRYTIDGNGYPSGGFSAMLNSLSTSGYLTINPVDAGCGGSKVTYPTSVGTAHWTPCGTNSIVTYQYVGGVGVYTLILNKEGGGSAIFLSPQ